MMLSVAVVFLAVASNTPAVSALVTPPFGGPSPSSSSTALRGGMSGDVGIPCEAECAIEKYPNLPESIHPGVLSGQAMMDLLRHAKDNGAFVLEALLRTEMLRRWSTAGTCRLEEGMIERESSYLFLL